jgi:protein tyrosine/serine phosphatase
MPTSNETRVRVDDFMKIMANPHKGPCYLSCQSGKDRTGMLIAWYRVAAQGWSVSKAFGHPRRCTSGGCG